ncbi:MAG TPA: error-prone DNA polymerase [Acidimicrobiales bacterium]|nr:error-prone DNA polymerase [Acidimicrobiales bacterium]
MGWRNPAVPWTELERRLSGGVGVEHPFPGDGSDSPAWSRRRASYDPAPLPRATGTVAYAELHCHSHFSFLDGASSPEALVEEAVRLGLDALALTDHDGVYGVVRFAEAARVHGLPTVIGAELTLDAHAGGAPARTGAPDPPGHHLVVLARGPTGYARLTTAISEAQLAGEKGAPRLDLDRLAELAGPPGSWAVLTGCRTGAVPAALVADGPAVARRRLDELVERFGAAHTFVELWDHGDPLDSARNDALAALAVRAGVDPVATSNVHHATPAGRRLAAVVAAIRARRSLDELDGWLPAGGGAHLRSGAEQARRFARYPGVVERAATLGRELAFDLALVAPQLPPFPCPPGLDEMAHLRQLVEAGAAGRYGPRHAERVPGAWAQIDHELAVIEQLGFPGYFLVVWDLVRFCGERGILCQGRGSAANSAVCYALGVTKADAVSLGLLFERFLSPERDGPPDIDLDIESDRREEVIQYVYERHGRRDAAQVANVITYRAKSAVRDVARALGHAPGQQDAWAKEVDRWSPLATTAEAPDTTIPAPVLEIAAELEHAPRHLGIHSGGMVICDRPIIEVCPVEWGRMPGRSVLQWDKDDCAAVGLVKFDLLGLGMLTALHLTLDLVRDHHGVDIDLATLPQDPEVYDMLCRADSVGVFQVESRAQMATLPRLRPRTFYDLVVEVALIRPGPIQGGSVHPYLRRRDGREPVTYLHPLLERSLAKTLGVPLFQEQLMQMAIDVAGFSPGEADQLRSAMGAKRSRERMERLRARLFAGMAERGVADEAAERIYDQLAAFANYGFPESHSVSFAYLVYASSWLKRFYPAAFCAALLGAQPMGFYSPHTLVQDARRHGVAVRTPCVARSAVLATLEPPDPPDPAWCPAPVAGPGAPPPTWGEGGPAVRLGLAAVRGVGDDLAERIVAGRPWAGPEDLARRTGATGPQLEALATAGALGCFGLDRRRALWSAGAAAASRPDRLAGTVGGIDAPRLPGMDEREEALADLWATGVAPEGHPTRFVRERLAAVGVVTAADLPGVEHGARVRVAGVVTHRQRPATAGGTMFFNLEDETGLVNVVVSVGCYSRHRRVARAAPALVVRGRLERGDGGVLNVIAERLEPLDGVVSPLRSRDFR